MLDCICKVRIKTFITLAILTSIIVVVTLKLFKRFATNSEDEFLPILLWWTPFAPVDQIVECQNGYKCIISPNKKLQNNKNLKAFLFYGSHFKLYDVPTPRNYNIPWAILHEESPKNLQIFLHKEGQDLFNITSTFSRYSDFPLTFQYLKTLDCLTDAKFFVATKEKNALLRENAPVLYISSNCDTPSFRDAYVKELMRYVQVDSYGKCLNNKQLPKNLAKDYLNRVYEDELIAFVAKYKFTIAIENAICDDYITEKLWRPLIAGSVPIYLGSPSIEDWLPNNSVVLLKKFKSTKYLANYIQQLNENDDLYERYLKHKLYPNEFFNQNLSEAFSFGYYGIKNNNKEHPISAFQCFVCTAVHEQKVFSKSGRSVYDCPKPQPPFGEKDVWGTFWRYGKCELKAFFDGKNLTEQTFTNKTMFYLRTNDC